jgi:tRNA threonylcarbamoyladenosine biosynthesis protein TsaE
VSEAETVPVAAWTVRPAGPVDAAVVHEVTQAAFAGYGTLDPPSGALRETVESVAVDLEQHGGLLAYDAAGQPVGALRFARFDGLLAVRRVAVVPALQGRGVGKLLLERAEAAAVAAGEAELRLGVRHQLMDNLGYWQRRGYQAVADRGRWMELRKPLPVVVDVPTAGEMRALGQGLAASLRAGDLVLLTGELGAGKTTLTQGIGAGLDVRAPVTSPTFVVARVHPSLADGPPLVHVDAYRLGGWDELADLDLETSLDEAVTVVEWGGGLAEPLAEDRVEVEIRWSASDGGDARRVTMRCVGPRWAGQSPVGSSHLRNRR